MNSKIISLCGLHNPQVRSEKPQWRLEQVVGRLSELSGDGASAPLTAVVALIVQAQHQGEPVAWVAARDSTFFPPDVVDSGVDLNTLPVVRVKDARGAARAAEQLLRSGAFGLIVLDLGKRCDISMAMQGRLLGLVKRHETAVVCLTEKSDAAPSIGSMVSLRAVALRKEAGRDRFRCQVVALKDKRHGPGWQSAEVVRGPAGLR